MKVSETDNVFWSIIGRLLDMDFPVESWSVDAGTGVVKLFCPGDAVTTTLDALNERLKGETDYIRSTWKTGNNFDGKLEI
jgi:hypothetical protein